MPIVYESQSPVESAGSIAALQQRNDFREQAAARAASDATSRGFGGGNGSGVYDTGLQQAVFARNDQSFQREQDSLNRTGVTNQSLAQARWGMEAQTQAEAHADRQQAERFKLQSWLNEQELTQQERIRLTRMQNSIAAVKDDPTWTAEERAAIVAKLKTGIDPLEQRAHRASLAAEVKLKQAHADQYQLQASLEKQRLDIMAKTADDRTTFHPDPTALAAITEDLRAHLGQASAFLSDGQMAALAKAEAIRQGLGTHAYLQPDGKLVPFAGEGKPRAGKPQDPADPRGLTVEDYLKYVEKAQKSVEAKAKATVKNQLGESTSREPGLQHQQAQDDAVRNMLINQYGLPPDLSEFEKTLVHPPAAESGSGSMRFDPKKASYRKGQSAVGPKVASDATSQPFGGKTAPKSVVGQFDVEKDAVNSLTNVTAEEKAAAVNALEEAKKIVASGPLTPEKQAKLADLRKVYRAAADKGSVPSGKPDKGGVPPTDRWDF